MANIANINVNLTGQVNGFNLSQGGSVSTSPVGSTALAESILITTGPYQLIQSGTNFGNASSITVFNTGTGSINLAISSSGNVSNLGTVAAQATTSSFTGGNAIPSSIQWNQSFSGIYAQAVASNTYGVFVVLPA